MTARLSVPAVAVGRVVRRLHWEEITRLAVRWHERSQPMARIPFGAGRQGRVRGAHTSSSTLARPPGALDVEAAVPRAATGYREWLKYLLFFAPAHLAAGMALGGLFATIGATAWWLHRTGRTNLYVAHLHLQYYMLLHVM